MRLKCFACEVLARPLYTMAAHSPHVIDIELLKRGLHNRPGKLKESLQACIDACPPDRYDAIVLGYGLCGQATGGLAACTLPLVVPRAHDCITLFLGSRARYQEQFDRVPGTYWYVQDDIERRNGDDSTLAMGAGTTEQLQAVYQEYVEKYGQDNADYLMEAMGAWQRFYQRAAFIDLHLGDSQAAEDFARAEADRRRWAFERLEGDLDLFRRLLMGEWEGDFLVIPPGRTIIPTVDAEIIRCA